MLVFKPLYYYKYISTWIFISSVKSINQISKNLPPVRWTAAPDAQDCRSSYLPFCWQWNARVSLLCWRLIIVMWIWYGDDGPENEILNRRSLNQTFLSFTKTKVLCKAWEGEMSMWKNGSKLLRKIGLDDIQIFSVDWYWTSQHDWGKKNK